MLTRLLIFLSISLNKAFICPSIYHNPNQIKQLDINMINNNILDITINDKTSGKILVEKISALLPKVDSIGHNVLHANNEFIDYILNNTNYSDIMKKNIILASIKLAIIGDQFGSELLQLYYNIVDKCL